MTTTKWVCPECEHENTDSFADTTIPICENCERDFYWEDVLTPEQYKQANDSMLTAVIFRYWEGDVIALMPELPATYEGYLCDSFQHIGQHGGADALMIIRNSRPATPAEYEPLKRELESAPYYYNFKVYKRMTKYHRATFEANQRKYRNA